MRGKTVLEKLIRKTWRRTEKGTIIEKPEDAEVILTIQYTLKHLMTIDKQKGTCHLECFKKCYLTTNRRIFQSEVADEYFFSRDVASGYFKMYIDIFEDNLVFAKAVNTE